MVIRKCFEQRDKEGQGGKRGREEGKGGGRKEKGEGGGEGHEWGR